MCGWWESGRTGDGETPILCALLNAPTEKAAKEALQVDWPGDKEFRFFDEKLTEVVSNRFPLKPWMQKRIDGFRAG